MWVLVHSAQQRRSRRLQHSSAQKCLFGIWALNLVPNKFFVLGLLFPSFSSELYLKPLAGFNPTPLLPISCVPGGVEGMWRRDGIEGTDWRGERREDEGNWNRRRVQGDGIGGSKGRKPILHPFTEANHVYAAVSLSILQYNHGAVCA